MGYRTFYWSRQEVGMSENEKKRRKNGNRGERGRRGMERREKGREREGKGETDLEEVVEELRAWLSLKLLCA